MNKEKPKEFENPAFEPTRRLPNKKEVERDPSYEGWANRQKRDDSSFAFAPSEVEMEPPRPLTPRPPADGEVDKRAKDLKSRPVDDLKIQDDGIEIGFEPWTREQS